MLRVDLKDKINNIANEKFSKANVEMASLKIWKRGRALRSH